MLFELSLSDFLLEMHRLHYLKKSGVVVFVGETSKPGKIYFDHGEIILLNYDMLYGDQAFSAIKALKNVKFNFREKTPEQTNSSPITEEFFQYFDAITSPPSQQEDEIVVEQVSSYVSFEDEIPAPPQQSGGKKVLIADDGAVVRKALSRTLIEAGYRVVEAKDGKSSLDQLRNEKPDMMFLDLIMPGLDGYDVLKEIDRNPDLNKIPVVVLTSRDSLLDKVKGKLSKCDVYLTKPVDSSLLLDTVDQLIGPP